MKCPNCGWSDDLNERSLKQLNLYWKLLKIVCDHVDIPAFANNPDNLHETLKEILGQKVAVYNEDGTFKKWSTRSIAIHAMGNKRFNKYMDSVKDIIFGKILPENYREDFENELRRLL